MPNTIIFFYGTTVHNLQYVSIRKCQALYINVQKRLITKILPPYQKAFYVVGEGPNVVAGTQLKAPPGQGSTEGPGALTSQHVVYQALWWLLRLEEHQDLSWWSSRSLNQSFNYRDSEEDVYEKNCGKVLCTGIKHVIVLCLGSRMRWATSVLAFKCMCIKAELKDCFNSKHKVEHI